MGPIFRSLTVRYGTALLAIAVTLLARLLLDPWLDDLLPFLLCSLAVVVVAWHGGFGPAVLALVLGVLANAYFFLPPRHDLPASLAGHPVLLGGFLFLGVTIGLFSEGLRAARRRAEALASEALRRRLDLEQEIGQRKHLEQELYQRAEELAEADRRKDEFLAMLGHELRNPLANVRHAVELLRVVGPIHPQLEGARDVIDRQVRQMTRLVEDLQDVSRIRRGQFHLKKESVHLAFVVRSAVELANPIIHTSGQQLTVTLPPEPLLLEADPVRLAQVFANLLTNAAKYTDRGGRIDLTAHRHGREALIAVKDNGIGIAREHLPRLFEMFSQVPGGRERSQGGLGIGLSLVRGLVEMHGGRVEAHSAGPGQGSEFQVRLPLAE
jgi:signal transduction histidine kinase